MTTTIFCRPYNGKNNFYLDDGSRVYYLFSQNYRFGVKEYYKNGVCLKDAMDMSKSKKDIGILKTMEKLPKYIKYIEEEYEIEILEKTKRAHAGRRYAA